MDLSDFIEGCDNMKDVMRKAKQTDTKLMTDSELFGLTQSNGIEILEAKDDFALVRLRYQNPMSVSTFKVIHPYGSDLVYHLDK